MATVVFGIVAVALGIVFKGQNVAFMVGLAFAIAASANFPALLMSIVWKRFTTQGRGLVDPRSAPSARVAMIVLSPTVWVDIFQFEKAIFPLKNPAIVSMTLRLRGGHRGLAAHARAGGAGGSSRTEKLRTYLGVGAE